MTRRLCLTVFMLAPLMLPAAEHSGSVFAAATSSCPVTIPSPSTVPPPPLDPAERPSQRDWLWHGNQYLWTQIPPDGVYEVDKAFDGMQVKVPWFRMVRGRLSIHGHPVGARRPRVKSSIPHGYGPSGFQATGITFPRTGCWRITGKVAGHGLSYVVRVVKSP